MLAELNHLDFTVFHFLRPELLWLIILLVLILFTVKQISNRESSWQKVISPHLIKFLMIKGNNQGTKNSLWLTGLIAFLIIIAVSGPAIREKNVPVFQTEDSRVILLDLSLSMDATDIKPSRIDRARFKIKDILEQTKEGTIGLVIYAGDAFVISPLTSDSNTIASMIPTLSTAIMPVLGSRPDIAMQKAIELLDNAKQSSGQIIWITDGVEEEFHDGVIDALSKSKHLLSVLAIGTEQGAPIPLPDGTGFLKDSNGNIILPKLNASNLKSIVTKSNGQYVELTSSNDDINFIMNILELQKQLSTDDNGNLNATESDKRISRWIDDGYWISWIIGLLFLLRLLKNSFSFSSGSNSIKLQLSIVFLLLVSGSITSFDTTAESIDAEAIEDKAIDVKKTSFWNDLWKTKDQQAQQAFEEKDYKKAASLFEKDNWRASANYKSDNFESAVSGFSKGTDTESFYNLANSLAKSQKLQEAIDAYDKTLALEPEHEDAIFNKKIVEELLKQQQEQEKKDKEKQDKQDKEDQEKQDENKEQSDSDSDTDSEKENKEQSEEEKEQEQKEKENQQQQEKEAEISEDERDKNEKDQALKHWLEKIPDDPGGLLRRKMYREYQRRGREQKEEKVW